MVTRWLRRSTVSVAPRPLGTPASALGGEISANPLAAMPSRCSRARLTEARARRGRTRRRWCPTRSGCRGTVRRLGKKLAGTRTSSSMSDHDVRAHSAAVLPPTAPLHDRPEHAVRDAPGRRSSRRARDSSETRRTAVGAEDAARDADDVPRVSVNRFSVIVQRSAPMSLVDQEALPVGRAWLGRRLSERGRTPRQGRRRRRTTTCAAARTLASASSSTSPPPANAGARASSFALFARSVNSSRRPHGTIGSQTKRSTSGLRSHARPVAAGRGSFYSSFALRQTRHRRRRRRRDRRRGRRGVTAGVGVGCRRGRRRQAGLRQADAALLDRRVAAVRVDADPGDTRSARRPGRTELRGSLAQQRSPGHSTPSTPPQPCAGSDCPRRSPSRCTCVLSELDGRHWPRAVEPATDSAHGPPHCPAAPPPHVMQESGTFASRQRQPYVASFTTTPLTFEQPPTRAIVHPVPTGTRPRARRTDARRRRVARREDRRRSDVRPMTTMSPSDCGAAGCR